MKKGDTVTLTVAKVTVVQMEDGHPSLAGQTQAQAQTTLRQFQNLYPWAP